MKTIQQLIQAIANAEAESEAQERLAALKTELAQRLGSQRKAAQTQTEQPQMFDLEPAATEQPALFEYETPKAKCKTCQHIQGWQCNSKVFFYCGIRHSNRTENRLLKIKANMPACPKYKPKP